MTKPTNPNPEEPDTSPPTHQKSFYRRPLPSNLVDFNSAEGKSRFSSALEAGHAETFFPLISQFQTQSHPALCGLTTLSTILNALQIDPKRVWNHPWRWFAESLLDCCLNMEDMKTEGITMDQLACTAACQGSTVRALRGLSAQDARDMIRDSARGNADGSFEFIVAAYDRQALGQTGTGHFSPIAAYDHASDSVLVLDVARFKVSSVFRFLLASCNRSL
uniref:glutathione gamma-glutamylcysteinyltransferase n=1 Tax=Eucheuma denticulatum TaxID=305493 RepID=A0AA94YIJ2_9FLOR|nr:phytochelatin synthase [Eucheuma denticulatum]